MAPPICAPLGEKIWHYALRVFVALVLFFLIAPLAVIVPLSFNALPYFTFTDEMLALDPAGYSMQWYEDFFTSPNWRGAMKNSIIIALATTALATTLGTLAALGLANSALPYRAALMAILISPMIVPLIISAAAMFFFYSRFGLQGTHLGVILAHTALATPFVVVTVTATLAGFDRSLSRAAASLGAPPTTVFFRVIAPLIAPGHYLGRAVRFHHFVRRGRGRFIRRLARAAHDSMANVFGHSGKHQPDDSGRGDGAHRLFDLLFVRGRNPAATRRANARLDRGLTFARQPALVSCKTPRALSSFDAFITLSPIF